MNKFYSLCNLSFFSPFIRYLGDKPLREQISKYLLSANWEWSSVLSTVERFFKITIPPEKIKEIQMEWFENSNNMTYVFKWSRDLYTIYVLFTSQTIVINI